MTGTDVLIETEIYQKYDLIIDNNCCGRCFTHNKRIVALDVNLPNHWSIFYCAGNDYQLKICKILISKPSKKWYNINQKMFDQKTKDEVKSCIDKLPKDTELWRQIKQLCQKAYEYADDKEKFKRWTKEQYIDSLQSQLDQQKAMWNELKKWAKNELNKINNIDFEKKSLYDNSIEVGMSITLNKMQELEQGEKDDNG